MKKTQEPKYNAVKCKDECRLQNRQSGELIPDDEPIFILRARDIHAILMLEGYATNIIERDHRIAVQGRIEDFREFAANHPERMKEPDTEISEG